MKPRVKIMYSSEFKMADVFDSLRKGKEVYIKAEVDEITEEKIICKNKFGYDYSIAPSEVFVRLKARWIKTGTKFNCSECDHKSKKTTTFCPHCGSVMDEPDESI